jgi:hypothetical protein
MNSALIKTHVHGHVHIKDGITGEVLVDQDNAIHNQNMAVALARGLSNDPGQSGIQTSQIFALELGNGGSVTTGGVITYQSPNVTGTNARLYNQTYFDQVDENTSGFGPGNSVTYQQSQTDTTSIVIVTMTVAAGEPSGQDTSDSTPPTTAQDAYDFDELGLFTNGVANSTGIPGVSTFGYTQTPDTALLLSHIIFSPILKTSSRELVITYTLTISVS